MCLLHWRQTATLTWLLPAGQVRQLSSCCERILLENQLLRQQLQLHQGQMGLQVMGGQQMRVSAATHLLQVRAYTVILQPVKLCCCQLCHGLREKAAPLLYCCLLAFMLCWCRLHSWGTLCLQAVTKQQPTVFALHLLGAGFRTPRPIVAAACAILRRHPPPCLPLSCSWLKP